MLKKLNLVLETLKGSLFQLVIKSAVFSLLLYFSGVNNLLLIFFVALTLYFYLTPSLNNSEYAPSFIVLLYSALAGFNTGLFNIDSKFHSVLFGALFFMLLSVKNKIFTKSDLIYTILNPLIMSSAFFVFFASDKETVWLYALQYFISILVVFLLFSEFFSYGNALPNSKKKLIALSLTFLVAQIIWALLLLPIGPLLSASFLTILVLVLYNFLRNYLNGTMTRSLVLRNSTVFIILAMFIFFTANWSL